MQSHSGQRQPKLPLSSLPGSTTVRKSQSRTDLDFIGSERCLAPREPTGSREILNTTEVLLLRQPHRGGHKHPHQCLTMPSHPATHTTGHMQARLPQPGSRRGQLFCSLLLMLWSPACSKAWEEPGVSGQLGKSLLCSFQSLSASLNLTQRETTIHQPSISTVAGANLWVLVPPSWPLHNPPWRGRFSFSVVVLMAEWS